MRRGFGAASESRRHSASGAPYTPTKLYQPLAVGDYWKYICNQTFTIEDRIVAAYDLNGRVVYALSLQIPSSPTKSVDVIQLLTDDCKIHPVTPAKIVASKPVLHQHYDYPAPLRGKISRIFIGFETTNRTPLGIFRVAPYFESGATHNYGYNLGRGVMEDHGPHYRYDCLIEKYVLRK
jgi:hypothetical protein